MDRKYLLAAHLCFDFSGNRWKEYCESLPRLDPFKEQVFQRRAEISCRSWDDAFALSEKIQCQRICFGDPEYPLAMKDVGGAPGVLYILGSQIPPMDSLISIVGTRKPSAFGYTNAVQFSNTIAAAGIGIVSGLAFGIDTLAHQAAVKNQSYTLAIIGSGFDHLYPRENEKLAQDILNTGGTILSPYPPATVPFTTNFPRRNRWIAAISAGTIVIEGKEKSGANITAQQAIQQHKPLVVLLQDFRTSAGRAALHLKGEGAHAALGIHDALKYISAHNGAKYLEEKAIPYSPEFSLEEYRQTQGLSLRESIISIEELLLAKKIYTTPQGKYCYYPH